MVFSEHIPFFHQLLQLCWMIINKMQINYVRCSTRSIRGRSHEEKEKIEEWTISKIDPGDLHKSPSLPVDDVSREREKKNRNRKKIINTQSMCEMNKKSEEKKEQDWWGGRRDDWSQLWQTMMWKWALCIMISFMYTYNITRQTWWGCI